MKKKYVCTENFIGGERRWSSGADSEAAGGGGPVFPCDSPTRTHSEPQKLCEITADTGRLGSREEWGAVSHGLAPSDLRRTGYNGIRHQEPKLGTLGPPSDVIRLGGIGKVLGKLDKNEERRLPGVA